MRAIFPYRLRGGVIVAGATADWPLTYANRTQAQRCVAELRANGYPNAGIYQGMGRPFYVRLDESAPLVTKEEWDRRQTPEKHSPPWTAAGHVHCFDPRHAEPCLQPCQACAEECDPKHMGVTR